MPLHCLGFSPLGDTLIASIGKDNLLIAMQQGVTLGHVVDVGSGADDSVDQAGFGIHSNVGRHAEVPLVAFLALVHLGVALTMAVLGRAGCNNQGGIEHSARLEHQTFGGHQLDTEVVLFQQMPEPQDGGLIRQSRAAGVKKGKLALQRGVVQGLFHGWVRQAKSLLQKMNAQHGLDGKQGATAIGT